MTGKNRELRTYLIGFALATLLTAPPFTLVWMGAGGEAAKWTIGICGALQLIVHLRLFLHLTFRGQQREDLQLVLFTGLILIFMIGGTVWIMGNLAGRM